LPVVTSFFLLTFLYTLLARFASRRLAVAKPQQTALAFAVYAGNYAFLGWGIINSFFGPQALVRAVFFSLLFWPVFLLSGFWLGHGSEIDDAARERSSLPRVVLQNAGLPLTSALLAFSGNLLHLPIPEVIKDLIANFAALVIPLILFSIGLHLRLRLPKSKLRLVLWAALLRLVGGFALGWLVMVAVSQILPLDPLSRKVILLQSVMPTATMSTFFLEHIAMDTELLTGTIAVATLLSLLTLPAWYFVIQTFF
jgi:hypothetical protein